MLQGNHNIQDKNINSNSLLNQYIYKEILKITTCSKQKKCLGLRKNVYDPCSWRFKWFCNTQLNLNAIVQTLQTKGREEEWIFMCLFSRRGLKFLTTFRTWVAKTLIRMKHHHMVSISLSRFKILWTNFTHCYITVINSQMFQLISGFHKISANLASVINKQVGKMWRRVFNRWMTGNSVI